ncbi:MAG TPA: serine protease, partial [Burkholderiales bacterium]|nr:serine protease [Burkholderiales bacterium]
MASAGAYAKTPEAIFDEASRSIMVVRGYAKDGSATNQGSGIVVSHGSVVTNCHVIEDAARIVVISQQQEIDASAGAADADRDLCALSVPKLAAPAARLAPGRLRVGQRVYAIGAPEGLELTISEGLVSSIREFEGSQYIQTSAPISAGSSGGGLFDVEGHLVGITAFFVPEG